MSNDAALRKYLLDMLNGSEAHAAFDQVVADFPPDRIGVRPQGLAHSAWELLEHMRIAQSDILEFSRSADYRSPKWPEGYWPASPAPQREGEWHESIRNFRRDLTAFGNLLMNPDQDLYRPFPWGDGQTLLREALLIIDHNSYHMGQLVQVRRALGVWPV
ncbi:MAG: DinB family protein [Bryobacteraceae bacterium]